MLKSLDYLRGEEAFDERYRIYLREVDDIDREDHRTPLEEWDEDEYEYE